MPREVAAAVIKKHLSEYLRLVEHGESVVITRYGKPVAALVRAEELAELARLRSAGPKAGLAGLVGRWEDADELVQRVMEIHEQGEATRPLPELE
jgi:prevent-host-death family protein